MPDQIPAQVKKGRLQLLMDAQNEISLQINKQLTGQLVTVMVEGPSKNDDSRLMGRTATNKIVLWDKQGTEEIGQLVQVRIETAQTWILKGQLIN